MSLASAKSYISAMDTLCLLYTRLKGSGNYGVGNDSSIIGCRDTVENYFHAFAIGESNSDFRPRLNSAYERMSVRYDADQLIQETAESLLSALRAHARTNSYGTIDALLTYFNTGAGGDYAALAPPVWKTISEFWLGTTPSPTNLYYEVLRNSTNTDGLGSFDFDGDIFTDGVAVDTAVYSGGIPKFRLLGTSGDSSVNVEVTGTQVKLDGTVEAGVKWTCSVDLTQANRLYDLSPSTAQAGALIANVSLITTDRNVSSVGFGYVEGHRPVLESGTAAANGSTTTLKAAASSILIDDVYNGLVLQTVGGKMLDLTITDYVAATQILTWVGAITSTVSGDAYRILRPLVA